MPADHAESARCICTELGGMRRPAVAKSCPVHGICRICGEWMEYCCCEAHGHDRPEEG